MRVWGRFLSELGGFFGGFGAMLNELALFVGGSLRGLLSLRFFLVFFWALEL